MSTSKDGIPYNSVTAKAPAQNESFNPAPPLSDPEQWYKNERPKPFNQQTLETKLENQILYEAAQDYANKTARPQWARQPMVWELYDGTMIEMYVNPQNVTMQANKKITQNRTKGGFVVQYWGDDLVTINLNGTTGSSGIEGIEILYDLYQSELLPPSRLDEIRGMGYASGVPGVNPGGKDQDATNLVRRSDLVSRATQVVLWYGSKRYHGFFTSFSVQEAATNPGEYTYTLAYTVWKTYGRDVNYMPWHRHPKPLSERGASGVPESDGSVSIYAIQQANNIDTSKK